MIIVSETIATGANVSEHLGSVMICVIQIHHFAVLENGVTFLIKGVLTHTWLLFL